MVTILDQIPPTSKTPPSADIDLYPALASAVLGDEGKLNSDSESVALQPVRARPSDFLVRNPGYQALSAALPCLILKFRILDLDCGRTAICESKGERGVAAAVRRHLAAALRFEGRKGESMSG
jgi:hypothetical protein